jgi:HlyD family secretion protein
VSRRTLALTVTVGLALLALLVWAFAPRAVEVELAQVSPGAFETSIDEEARTRLHDRYVVSAPLAGRLQRPALREGDVVTPDMQVATLVPMLSPMLDQRSVEELRARIGAAEAAVMRAQAQMAGARIASNRSEMDLRRTEQLAQQGFVAPSKIDGDRLAAQAAQKELDAATQGQHVARHDLEQARAALAVVRSGQPETAFALKSPIGGRVLKVHQASEVSLAAGAPVIDVGDTSRLEIVAELLSNDALLAGAGSPVRIEGWGGPKVLQGRMRSVEPAAFTKVSALGVEEQRVNVLIDITSPHTDWAALGDGYRVSVRIITRSEPRVLRVPVSALFPLPQAASASRQPSSAEASSAVFVYDQGRARLRSVNLGARNPNLAWVTQGLVDGERVIVYPPRTLSDGARVRVHGE